ncbi:tryptophanyl-tRNA synthetase-like protein [Periconia macrospinosa]|uniref:Tryptophan--tRNA ligase, mitochondrial n=1 Tax=Periconia macrospinosa TaxID=97972 RepID=A0A2V1DXB2_9PLEO|nr:tryptophanyl-tRNA synthetase-like protein [Periconia macrospinosa]
MFSPTTTRALRRAPSPNPKTYLCPVCRYSSSTKPNRIIFSGIQPTGVPHLGNYLGALRPWVKLQDGAAPDDQLLFSIVDLHAITIKQDSSLLRQWRKEMFASFLAVGLDPKKSILYAQSDVPAHAELMWILSCSASMGYLSRMTQWKSKMSLPSNANPFDTSTSKKKDAPALKLGLFSYPVLQAADILLYKTTHVPVGEDQAQHLEFARELAITFNHSFGAELLVPPQTIISPAKRVMSLAEPTKKMSKSDPDVKSRILITDTKEKIHKKIRVALTDSIQGVSYNRETRPGVSNLIDIMYHFQEEQFTSPEQLAQDLFGPETSLKALKEKVADTVDEHLREVREAFNNAMSMGDAEMSGVARESANTANQLASSNLKTIKAQMGLGWD